LDKAEKSANAQNTEVDYKERKQMQKDLKNAEKKIEKLEGEIASLEDLMAEPDFYERDNKDKKIAEYESKKTSLSKVMAVWEEVAMKLDQLG